MESSNDFGISRGYTVRKNSRRTSRSVRTAHNHVQAIGLGASAGAMSSMQMFCATHCTSAAALAVCVGKASRGAIAAAKSKGGCHPAAASAIGGVKTGGLAECWAGTSSGPDACSGVGYVAVGDTTDVFGTGKPGSP